MEQANSSSCHTGKTIIKVNPIRSNAPPGSVLAKTRLSDPMHDYIWCHFMIWLKIYLR